MTTPDPTPTPIEAIDLHRRYAGGFEAVRGVDLAVAAGTVTALLGTNGAGKTSTMEVLEGLATASDGTARVLGLDPVADRTRVRRRTGVLLQTSGFSGDLTVLETVRLAQATTTGARRPDEAIAMLDLEHRADVRVSSLSGGETRRLDLACALIGRPEVVFLDEPSTGLDPESRQGVWRLIRELRDAGATVLLTTHYLEEAEALADRLEIMHAGRIVRSGTAAEIVADRPATVGFTLPADAERGLGLDAVPGVLGRPEVDRSTSGDGRTRVTLRCQDLQTALTEVLGRAAEGGVRLDDLDARAATLESVFLEIARGSDDRDTSGRAAAA